MPNPIQPNQKTIIPNTSITTQIAVTYFFCFADPLSLYLCQLQKYRSQSLTLYLSVCICLSLIRLSPTKPFVFFLVCHLQQSQQLLNNQHFQRLARSGSVQSSSMQAAVVSTTTTTVSSSNKLGRSFSHIIPTAACGARSRRGASLDHHHNQLHHQRSMSGGGSSARLQSDDTASSMGRRPPQHHHQQTIATAGKRLTDAQLRRRSANSATTTQLDVIRLLSLMPNTTACAVSTTCLPTFNGTPIYAPP